MNINYQDFGAVARISLRSSIFERRKHLRVIDAVHSISQVTEHTTGWLILRTEVTGRTPSVMRAYKAIIQETSQ